MRADRWGPWIGYVPSPLDKLEAFASFFGADFYGLARNTGRIELLREAWSVPTEDEFGGEPLTLLRAGESVAWRVMG